MDVQLRILCYLTVMEEIHRIVRFIYARLSAEVQAEMILLSELSNSVDDERFRQSIAEVTHSLDDLSNTLDTQRRYLRPRNLAD